MKKIGKWKALLYLGAAVLAVVCLILLRDTNLDTYSEAQYISPITKISEKAIGLMFAFAMLISALICKAIRADVLGVGQALAAYAGITLPAISLFIPETVLHLRWMGVRIDYEDYIYKAIRGAVWATDTVCMFGAFILLVMIFGSVNSEYKEKVKKTMVGLGYVVLALGLISLGFKTLDYNSWVFVIPVLSVMFGCVVLFLCWTGKMMQFNVVGSSMKWMYFDYNFEEDDELDDEEDE